MTTLEALLIDLRWRAASTGQGGEKERKAAKWTKR
jgi:hypothetical protein